MEGDVVTQIIRKDEVLARLSKTRAIEIEARTLEVNQSLCETKDLPVAFQIATFGSTPATREILVKALRDAGWRVDMKSSPDSASYYEVQ